MARTVWFTARNLGRPAERDEFRAEDRDALSKLNFITITFSSSRPIKLDSFYWISFPSREICRGAAGRFASQEWGSAFGPHEVAYHSRRHSRLKYIRPLKTYYSRWIWRSNFISRDVGATPPFVTPSPTYPLNEQPSLFENDIRDIYFALSRQRRGHYSATRKKRPNEEEADEISQMLTRASDFACAHIHNRNTKHTRREFMMRIVSV